MKGKNNIFRIIILIFNTLVFGYSLLLFTKCNTKFSLWSFLVAFFLNYIYVIYKFITPCKLKDGEISIFKKHKKKVIIGIVLLSIILFISKYFNYKKERVLKDSSYMEEKTLNSNESKMVPNCEVPTSQVMGKFTVMFWININNHYENYLFWKHILHKGTPITQIENSNNSEPQDCKRNNILDFVEWNNLSMDIQEQCPGIWLHPEKNTIRFAITSELNQEYNKCELHAHPITKYVPDIKLPNTFIKDTIEYYDLPNIPINKLTHIAFIVDTNHIDIYLNGRKLKIFNLKGTPKQNNGAMYFNYQKTYNGYIRDFIYSPKVYTKEEIEESYFGSPLYKK